MKYFLIAFLFVYPFQSAGKFTPAHMGEEEKLVKTSRQAAVYVKPIKPTGHGSGTYVKIGKRYYIITAKHVTIGQTEFFVTVGKKTAIAKKIYESETKDISVLRVTKIKGAVAVQVGNESECSSSLKPGKTVVFSGYPSSYSLMTTKAFISGARGSTRYLQGFAWFGSSGSGIISRIGKLCGVITAIGMEKKGFSTHALETLNHAHVVGPEDIKKILAKEKRTKNER